MSRSALLPLAALALALAQPVLAQDAATPAPDAPAAAGTPAADLPTAEAVPAPPQMRTVATFDDWEVRCIGNQSGKDSCLMYQLLTETDGNPVAELSVVSPPNGGPKVAVATLVAPLQTLLTAGVALAVDTAQPRTYPFIWCDAGGCYTRIAFDQTELNQLKNGKAANVTIVPLMAPNNKVSVGVSLIGFTKAFDQMKALDGQDTPPEAAAPAAGGN